MSFAPIFKDKDAVIVRGFDWSEFIAAIADVTSIVTSQWISSVPLDLVVTDKGKTSDTTKCSIAGGLAGKEYTVTNRVTFNDDGTRIEDKALTIKIPAA